MLVIDIVPMLLVIRDFEHKLEEFLPEDEARAMISLAFSCAKDPSTCEAELRMAQEEMLDRTSSPLDLELSHRLVALEALTEAFSELFEKHRLYFRGQVTYEIGKYFPSCLVLVREDIYRRDLNREVDEKTPTPELLQRLDRPQPGRGGMVKSSPQPTQRVRRRVSPF